ncbi:MAG: hypothetical protein HY675_22710 [Chloroflexi bacterium]|nr:hypothetical protein [Chloroflexota bacterium]
MVIAVAAMYFALRRPAAHAEIRILNLKFHDEGGAIKLDAEMTTYSHAPRLNTKATLKLNGVRHPLQLEPIKAPLNYQFATVNTFQLGFTGHYSKLTPPPKMAVIEIRAKMSDGTKARLHTKIPLVETPATA